MNLNWVKRRGRDFDYYIIPVLVIISVISTLAIYSITRNRQGMEDWYIREIIWQIASYGLMFVFVALDYSILKNRIARISYYIGLLSLVIVFVFPASHGAHSWITLPGLQLQPSEFTKIFMILFIADYGAKQKELGNRFGWRQFGVMLAAVLVPALLILKQPALGQALVMLAIFFCMLVVMLEKKQFYVLLAASFVFVLAVVLAMDVFPDRSMHFLNSLPLAQHQKERFVTFLNPEADPTGAGFQVHEAEIAIGSGGLLGQGFLKGSQTQGNWVPEQWTDFIFSAIGEEFGYVGSSGVILLFFLLIYRMVRIAVSTEDYFAVLFMAGAIGMFGFQVFENIGMNLAIMPVAGITLPFISYGGSSLLTNFVVIGISLSIGIRRRKLAF
ncbi:rod shape-determining protein RodA [Effusibacillus dendaii]|uniref:Rod shape-determining protein RodA n=1 Tax=Effusibacillus dendaii TaxID=2743772 RepID=A0A7I8D9Y0_9BACL|nr:rod shape-determining protein RodA [Effusibacillus dendaii]BCJ85636.1 rod shape-determining protein RodA [Effusibacillus dendaii]